MDVTLSFIIIFANLLLLLATLLAWRMAWLTRERTAWGLIAAAASLMVMHRSLVFFQHSGRSYPAEFPAELLSLGFSALMLAGIIRLGPTFVSRGSFPEASPEPDKRYLSAGEEKYRFLLNNLSAVVFKGYADWSVEFPDDQIEALLGYKKEDFAAGLKWSELILPEDLETAKASFLRGLKGDKTYQREYRVRHKNGDLRWVRSRGQIFCREDGRIDFISGVIFDITEAKLDKLALQESEERHHALMENLKFGVVMVDHDYRIKMVNKAVRKNFPRPLQELVGQKCFKVFEKRSSLCPHCPGRQAMASGRPAEAETEGVRDDGSRYPVRLLALPLLEPNGVPQGFIEIVEDIAERREFQEERLRWSKLESLGLLAGGIAHDFNNILTAIQGNLYLARLDLPQTRPLREFLEASEKACLQAQNLAQQLLTLAKEGAPVKRPIFLADIVRQSLGFTCRGP